MAALLRLGLTLRCPFRCLFSQPSRRSAAAAVAATRYRPGRLYGGLGESCAVMEGLLVRRPRLPVVHGEAADTDPTLFDLINEGADMTDLDAAPVALDLLRRQVAALLSQIDTATLPRPDRIRGRGEHPGPEWTPTKGWRVFTIDTPESAGAVYVDHDCDAESLAYRWDGPGNWEALRIEDARRIGLAFLAAAQRAEELFAGVSRLHGRARGDA